VIYYFQVGIYIGVEQMKKIIFWSALIITACVVSTLLTFPDWDLWARLAVGSIFFQTGKVLHQDIFAYTPTKPIWIDHEWGSGVIFYAFAKLFGDLGLIFFKILLVIGILFFLIKIIKLNLDKDARIDPLFIIFLGICIMPNVLNIIRCQLFTFLFFSVFIYILERSRREEYKFIWILPVIMLFWANLHAGFVAGLGLIAIYTLGEYLNGNDIKKYLIILGVLAAVTLINPYGIHYIPFIIESISMPRPLVPEWRAINFEQPYNILLGFKIHGFIGFMILIALTVLSTIKAIIKENKPDWVRIFLVIITLYAGLSHQRHAFFFVAGSALLYNSYADLLKGFLGNTIEKIDKDILKFLSNAKTVLTILLLTILGWFFINNLNNSGWKLLTRPEIYPVGSFEFIKQNNLKGNLAVPYNWGSYALWKLYPEVKVLNDGRCEEVYPQDVIDITSYFYIHLNERWKESLERYHTDIIIIPKIAYTMEDIRSIKGWQIVYEDTLSMVLLPASKAKNTYVLPGFDNPLYWHEDLSKHIKLK